MKYTVFFVLPSLEGGGAERFVVTLIRYLDRSRFSPSLILASATGPYLSDVPDDVPVFDLHSPRISRALPSLVRLVRIHRPDLLFSTLGYLNLSIAMVRPFFPGAVRCIAREAILVSENLKTERNPTLFRILYRLFYRRFDRIVAQTEAQSEDLIESLKVPRKLITVIPNFVDNKPASVKFLQRGNSGSLTSLIAVGRLDYQKGFDLLLKAFSKLPNSYSLTILGKGREKENLKELALSLGVSSRVHWKGFNENPLKEMAAADLFVLSSRYEGFPNVVLESLSIGLPVIAFDGLTSAGEIIRHKMDGLLVDNGDIKALEKAIQDASGIQFDRQEIRDSVLSRFAVPVIIRKWEHLFSEILI